MYLQYVKAGGAPTHARQQMKQQKQQQLQKEISSVVCAGVNVMPNV